MAKPHEDQARVRPLEEEVLVAQELDPPAHSETPSLEVVGAHL